MRTLLLAAALSFAATTALAHPKLLSASPAPASTVAGSPKELRMTFSEGLVAKLCGVEITSKAGAPVKTAATALAPKTDKQLVTPIVGKLAPGAYHVAWHAVSTDTHRVQGQFDFTVK